MKSKMASIIHYHAKLSLLKERVVECDNKIIITSKILETHRMHQGTLKLNALKMCSERVRHFFALFTFLNVYEICDLL